MALYELRKSLSQHRLGFDDEAALLEETKQGLALSSSAKVDTDIDDFLRLYSQWQAAPSEVDFDLLKQICLVYQGPFLEDGEFDDWVTIQREHYASLYFEALHALGEMASSQGRLEAEDCLLRGLELDPLDELSYAHLISLYEKTGQHQRAKTLGSQFKKRFKQEMGFEAKL